MHASPIVRRISRQIMVGNVPVGGGAPISIQSMTNTETCDVEATVRQVVVRELSEQRGPAPVAQRLYEETPESIVAREAAREQRALMGEPARAIQGRPTTRDRRAIERARGEG